MESKINEMELSRNSDILSNIDKLYDSMNNILNDTEFNDLLISLKDIHISEVNSTFNNFKILLESIKTQYIHEDFTQIAYFMNTLELLLNEELDRYENLTSELDIKLAELYELFEKYPFLVQNTKYAYATSASGYGEGYGFGESNESSNKVLNNKNSF